MPLRQIGSLQAFQFNSLDHPSVTHAIFTRHGGVSPAPWESLNVGRTVGDDLQNVLENERRILEGMNLDKDSKYEVWQCHSAEVVVADTPISGENYTRADGILTRRRDLALIMRFADCVPILLFDPNSVVIGVVHAGWKGTVAGIAQRAVAAMQEAFGSHPEDVVACIGPSVGPDHYPIGEDVIRSVTEAFGASASRHLSNQNGRTHFDLWSANTELLRNAGVGSIEHAGLCTVCDLENWYSHRGEQGRTGRFAGLIALRDRSSAS